MSRTLKTMVVLLMLAVLPVRALAAVTVGFCAMHHHGAPTMSQHAAHEHGVPQSDNQQCNACVEHCSNASVVAPSELSLAAAALAERITAAEPFAGDIVPDRLDRPPLAL